MKYLVILCDGMADFPVDRLGGKTPLEVAVKPNMNALSGNGTVGLVKTVPDSLKPGSDVANLAVMGYPPAQYYSGRSPLEALSMGVALASDDVAIRCNLVTLGGEGAYADKTMADYSAGEIGTQEARELIGCVQQALGDERFSFYGGFSYRHCLVAAHAVPDMELTPPHDISGKRIGDYLPKGALSEQLLTFMERSYALLSDHPINRRRIAEGKNPANSIWLWGAGTRPALDRFYDRYGLKGGVISAVDLLKGIGIGADMRVIEVEGATGTYKTNFRGKADAALQALKDLDYVYLHMEAPDECGHQGDLEHKILSIELIDRLVVGPVVRELLRRGEAFRVLLAPDHPTPIAVKTHTRDSVPYILYDSAAGLTAASRPFNEKTAQNGVCFQDCQELINLFLKGERK